MRSDRKFNINFAYVRKDIAAMIRSMNLYDDPASSHIPKHKGKGKWGMGVYQPIGGSPYGSRSPTWHQLVTKGSLVHIIPLFVLALLRWVPGTGAG